MIFNKFAIGWLYWTDPKDGYLVIKINDNVFREDDKDKINTIRGKIQRFCNGHANWGAKDTIEELRL